MMHVEQQNEQFGLKSDSHCSLDQISLHINVTSVSWFGGLLYLELHV